MCLTTLQEITFTRKQIYMLKRQEKKNDMIQMIHIPNARVGLHDNALKRI